MDQAGRRATAIVLTMALGACGPGPVQPPAQLTPTPSVYVSTEGPLLNLKLSFTAGGRIYHLTTPSHRSDRPLILAVRVFNRGATRGSLPAFHLENALGERIRPIYVDPIPDDPYHSKELAAYITYPVSVRTSGLSFVVTPDPDRPERQVRLSLDSGRVQYP